MSGLNFVADHHEVAGKLLNGWFVILPWERADDPGIWCEELVAVADDLGVGVCVQPISNHSVTLIYNMDAIPSYERARDAIALIEHDRFMTRDSRRLLVTGYRAS
ncbi:hypothetical protein SD37_11835 [Amycolatopsis orientalis]|uniref:Uncharacterized protein n=1 Tax=Amycolatopsis orientalis TaxID=31958 RepID=A0A193BVS3_AMYOR|nr:hypothetical protein [Amycolatopsis orientalis]ANN16269.1 hypothetical protein SD37_11835 [Amycolatopsis orientalis]